MKNDRVVIVGKITSEFEYSHEAYGEKFYSVTVAVDRLSGQVDYIPVITSGQLINVTGNNTGQIICVKGQLRSLNWQGVEKSRLLLSVFAAEIEFMNEINEDAKNNQIFLDGYVCKEAIYRKTPLGREITDLLLAVHRSYGKSDYIPCICWGKGARLASGFKVGEHIQIEGRIQSREYTKKISESDTEVRVAYEVSVSEATTLTNQNQPE